MGKTRNPFAERAVAYFRQRLSGLQDAAGILASIDAFARQGGLAPDADPRVLATEHNGRFFSVQLHGLPDDGVPPDNSGWPLIFSHPELGGHRCSGDCGNHELDSR